MESYISSKEDSQTAVVKTHDDGARVHCNLP